MGNPITLEHIRQAAEWAKTANDPKPLDGETKRYDQSNWDCGTSCCMWGAASIISGNGKATTGPPKEWATDKKTKLIAALLRSSNTTPEQVLAIIRADLSEVNLSKANLSGADLSEVNLSGANLSGADLSGANLSEANLSGADLSWANLSKADLSGVNLSGANLSKADLSGANLSEANLSEANLSEANLSEADLSWAKITIGNIIRTIK